MAEELTKDLLTLLFNSRNAQFSLSGKISAHAMERRWCPKCHGTGLWSRLEQSELGENLKRLMWYRCDLCPRGKLPTKQVA